MKVICIKHDTVTTSGPDIVPHGSIKEGMIYTVTETKRFIDGYYYLLEEAPMAWYGVELFAPLSEIDETTFERNYNTQPC